MNVDQEVSRSRGKEQRATPEIADTIGRKATMAMGVVVIGFGLHFVGSVIVARLLGTAGKGAFSLFLTTVALISLFAGFGVGQGQMYHASRQPEKLKHFLANGCVISLLFGGTAAVLYFTVGHVANLRIVSLGTAGLVAGVLLVPVVSFLVFQKQYLLTTQHFVLSRSSFALNQALPLIAVIVLYALVDVTVQALIIAITVGMVLELLLFDFLTRRQVSHPTHVSPRYFSMSFAKESFTFGIRQYLSNLTLFLVNRLDFFLVVWFLDHAALGIYSVAVGVAEIVSRLPRELGVLLYPVFASDSLRHGQAPAMMRKVLLLAILMAGFLTVISEPLILLLYGEEFQGSIPVFRLLLIGAVAWSTIQVTWNRVSAGGQPGMGVPIFGAAALVDAGLNALLLPRIGVEGAAIAASVSYALAAILFLRLFCARENCSIVDAVGIRVKDLRSIVDLVKGLPEFVKGYGTAVLERDGTGR